MKVDRKKLRALAEITVECEPDQTPIRGNASAWGETEERQCETCTGTGLDPTIQSIDDPPPEPCDVCSGKGTIKVDLDEELANELIERVQSGDDWAWCVVTVRATYAGCSESDSLGGCSYASERQFRAESGYYDDMVAQAIESLAKRLEEYDEDISAVLADPPARRVRVLPRVSPLQRK